MTFSSAEMQEHIQTAQNLVIGFDASFKMAGNGIYEVFSWHILVGNEVSGVIVLIKGNNSKRSDLHLGTRYILAGSAFLTKKDTATIRRAFKSMFENPGALNIQLMVGDWEQAQWIVVRELFPNLRDDQLQKCQFHYSHNVQKLAKSKGEYFSFDCSIDCRTRTLSTLQDPGSSNDPQRYRKDQLSTRRRSRICFCDAHSKDAEFD